MVRNSKKKNSVFSEEVHLEAAEKLQLEKRIDELNFKTYLAVTNQLVKCHKKTHHPTTQF